VTMSENHTRVLREQAHLLDLVLDAIILRDMQGAIISWNQGAEKLYGWTSDEVLGKHAHTLLHTQFPQPLEAIEAEALRAGQWEGELIHTRRDGTPVWSPAAGPCGSKITALPWPLWRSAPTSPSASRSNVPAPAGRGRAGAVCLPRRHQPAGQHRPGGGAAVGRLVRVHITEEGQPIRPVAVAHADPQKLAQANDLLRRDPPDPDAPPGAVHVLRTGRPEFYPEASEDLLAAIARDADQIELVRALGVKSAMIVPLVTRGHTLGTITLVVSAESGRQYAEVDLALAEELARRAALAVDNARLYAEAQQLNAELEERVVQRTAELQAPLPSSRTLGAGAPPGQHERISREEDRARMAREVHDQLGQALTGLKMDLPGYKSTPTPNRRTCCKNSERCRTWWTLPSRTCGASPPSCVRACWMTWDWCRRWSGSCRSSKSAAGFAADSLRVWRRWRWTPRKPPSSFASCRRP